MILRVTSAASLEQTQIASLGYVSVFGTELADGTYTSPDANYGTKLGSTEIFVCPTSRFYDPVSTSNPSTSCQASRIAFASPGQVTVVMPDVFANDPGQTSYFAVARVNGKIDAMADQGHAFPMQVHPFSPSIFLAGSDCATNGATAVACGLSPTFASSGRAERGVITDVHGNVIWSGNRARLGQYYTIWLTGMGTIPTPSGQEAPVHIAFIDIPAFGYPNPESGIVDVTYSGAVPQSPGLYQVNFRIPKNIGEGPAGYGAWPCGNYNWELTLDLVQTSGPSSGQSANRVQIPLTIKNGDVACSQ